MATWLKSRELIVNNHATIQPCNHLFMNSCLFCKIVNREIESNIVYEDKDFVVFPDISPRAPLHLLIVPKEHIEELYLLEKTEIWSKILSTVKKLITAHNLAGKGYRLVINGGGAQAVNHLHVHLMGEISKNRNV